jgi:tetratricopeptide (TPR) repeat protein
VTSTSEGADGAFVANVSGNVEKLVQIGNVEGDVQLFDAADLAAKVAAIVNVGHSDDAVLCVDVPPPSRIPLVGRDALVSTALAHLVDGRDVVFLSGLPGVGKSALAKELARNSRLSENLPDGVLWVGLGPGSSSAKTTERLRRWATALGASAVDLAAISTVDDLAVDVSRRLADRHALVVIDDAWDEDAALTFRLGGAGSVHVVTTRMHDVASAFEERGAAILEVEELDDGAAMELLELVAPRAVKRFPEEARVCVRQVHGLPLAVWIIGHFLNARPEPLLAKAFQDMLSAENRLRAELKLGPTERPDWLREDMSMSLYAALEQSTEGLGPARDELANLSVFPPKGNSFSWRAATAVASKGDEVETLWRNGLVEELGPDRLTIHQAVFDYARLLLSDDDAYRRMASYYIDIALEEGRTDRSAWLTQIEDDHENLRAALDWAISRAEAGIGLRLAGALWPFWYERNLFSEGRQYIGQLLALPGADSPDLIVERAKVLNDAGNFSYNQGDLDTAEELLRQAHDLRRSVGDTSVRGSLNNLGLIARSRGHYGDADPLFQEAATLNEQVASSELSPAIKSQAIKWHAINLNNLGISALEQGDLHAARLHQEASLELFSGLPDAWGIAMASSDVGEILLLEGDLDSAREHWRSSGPDQHARGDSRELASTLRRLAGLPSNEIDLALAVDCWWAALNLSVDISDMAGTASALEGLASHLAPGDATRVLGSAARYRETSGYLPAARTREPIRQLTEQLRSQANPDFEVKWSEGQTMAPTVLARLMIEGWKGSVDQVIGRLRQPSN